MTGTERPEASGARILAVCPNPTIDIWSEAKSVHPVHKIRTAKEIYDPGGGGTNLARVIAELGGNVDVVAMAGGVTGSLLGELLGELGIRSTLVPIADRTRVSYTVHDQSSGFEYRFVSPGPAVTAGEVDACMDAVRKADFDYLVASGSLPPEAPSDFFLRLAEIAAQKSARFVVDTSGEALLKTLRDGRVFLAKPSIGELSAFVGNELDETGARDAAIKLVHDGNADMIAVSMGSRGAMLAFDDRIVRSAAPVVNARSTVGAGDSFLGAIIWAFAQGQTPEEALAMGVAAGAAAVLTPGTKLCRREDVEYFRQQLPTPTAHPARG